MQKSDDWPGSADWWRTVQSMPLSEALQHLNDYKAMLIERNHQQTQQIAAQALLTRVNAEIKRLNRLIGDASLKAIAKEVLPPEWYEQLCVAHRLAEMGRPYKDITQ